MNREYMLLYRERFLTDYFPLGETQRGLFMIWKRPSRVYSEGILGQITWKGLCI